MMRAMKFISKKIGLYQYQLEEMRQDYAMHPAGRVQELRQDGNEIDTLRYSLPSDIGRPHSIAVYVLREGAHK